MAFSKWRKRDEKKTFRSYVFVCKQNDNLRKAETVCNNLILDLHAGSDFSFVQLADAASFFTQIKLLLSDFEKIYTLD